MADDYKVSIELAAKVSDYVRGVGVAAKATDTLRGAQQGATRSSAALAAELTAAGAAAKGSAADYRDAARGVAALERAERRLDETRTKAASTSRGGTSGGRPSSASTGVPGPRPGAAGNAVTAVVKDIPGAAKTALISGVVAGAVAAAPLAGAAIAGGVLAAVGGGAIGAGFAASLRDPAVNDAIDRLQKRFGAVADGIAGDFTGEVRDSIAVLDHGFTSLGPEIRAALAPAAGYIEPLTRGLDGFIREALPGLKEGIADAKPVFDVLAAELPGLGRTVGDLFSTFSEHAGQGAAAVQEIIYTVEDLITIGGTVVGWLGDAYETTLRWRGAMVSVGASLPDWLGGGFFKDAEEDLRVLQDTARGVDEAGRLTGSGTFGLAKSVGALSVAADTTAKRTKVLNSTMHDGIVEAGGLSAALQLLTGGAVDAERAEIRYQDAIDRVTASIKKNGRSLDEHTAKGRANKASLLDVRDAVVQRAQAVYDNTAATKGQAAAEAAATAELERGRKQLIKSYLQFSNNKAAAEKYATAVLGIPGDAATRVRQPGMVDALAKTRELWEQLKGVDGNWVANLRTAGYDDVATKLRHLLAAQQAAKKGVTFNETNRELGHFFAGGGWTGPGSKWQPAGVVHADEFVIQKSSRRKIEAERPGLLDRMNATGQVPPGYAGGGVVLPFPFALSKTKIPDGPAGAPAFPGAGKGGTLPFILAAVRAAFPGMPLISGFRPNSRTLSGDRSLHADNRAGDFPPSRPLADWWNLHFLSKTKEFISPWNELNILNGRRHAYSGAVYRQHSGSNAHDHIAMANGGVIREPVFGVGASGRTYSFAELGPERVTPYAGGGLVGVAPSQSSDTNPRLGAVDAYISARDAVVSLNTALKDNGRSLSLNTTKGRANRAELNNAIKAAQASAEAKYTETGSVRAANRAYDAHLASLRRVLRQQGANAAALRAAFRVAGRPSFASPAPQDSSSTIGFVKAKLGLGQAAANARNFFTWGRPTFDTNSTTGGDELNQLFTFLEQASGAAQARYAQTGSVKSATVLYNQSLGVLRGILGKAGMRKTDIDKLLRTYGRITLASNATGGVHGGLTQAMALGAGDTLYQWREPSTGGEAFVPKNGPRARSEQVLQTAAGWYGGRYVRGGRDTAGAGGGMTVRVVVDDGAVRGLVRVEVDEQFGALADAHVYATAG